MARQPYGLGNGLLKRLLGSLFVVLCLFGSPATGWEIDLDDPMVPETRVRFEDVPEILDELPPEAFLERTRTLAWHEGLLQILSHQGASRQVLRPPVPSVEDICISLEVVLPSFDLAADHLPEPLQQRLCKRIRTYAVRYRWDVQTMLYRADDYLPMIKRSLRNHGLPTYYAYVPLVESAFQVDAMHDGSGARGLWQLVRDTARARGLTVSKAVDERLHPKRSTQAAVSYLAHLDKRFGDHGPSMFWPPTTMVKQISAAKCAVLARPRSRRFIARAICQLKRANTYCE